MEKVVRTLMERYKDFKGSTQDDEKAIFLIKDKEIILDNEEIKDFSSDQIIEKVVEKYENI